MVLYLIVYNSTEVVLALCMYVLFFVYYVREFMLYQGTKVESKILATRNKSLTLLNSAECYKSSVPPHAHAQRSERALI